MAGGKGSTQAAASSPTAPAPAGSNITAQQTSPPPQFQNWYNALAGQALNLGSQPWPGPYPGRTVAGFTPQQMQAFNQINQVQGQFAPFVNAAGQAFGQATQPLWPSLPQYNVSGLPEAGISAIGQAPQYAAAAAQPIAQQVQPYAQLAQTSAQSAPQNLSAFYSPFTQQVAGNLQNLFNQQNAQQLAQVAGSEVGQGAFGGDRQAVAEALTAQQQQLAQAPVMAQTLQQGFQAAQQQAAQQAALETQAAAQGGQLMAGAFGQQGQLGLGAGQLNLAAGQGLMQDFTQQQQAQLAAEQANAWLASQAGFGLANLGQEQQMLGLQGAQALQGAGGLQQQLAQEQLNVPYEEWQQMQFWPYQQLQFAAPIVEGTGSLAGYTAATATPGPTTAGQVAGLGLLGTAVLGGTGAFGSKGWLTNLLGGGSQFPNVSQATAQAIGAPETAGMTPQAYTNYIMGLAQKRGGRVGFQGGGSAGLGSSGVSFATEPTLTDPGIGMATLPATPDVDVNLPQMQGQGQTGRGAGAPGTSAGAGGSGAGGAGGTSGSGGFDPLTNPLGAIQTINAANQLGQGLTSGTGFLGAIGSGIGSAVKGIGSFLGFEDGGTVNNYQAGGQVQQQSQQDEYGLGKPIGGLPAVPHIPRLPFTALDGHGSGPAPAERLGPGPGAPPKPAQEQGFDPLKTLEDPTKSIPLIQSITGKSTPSGTTTSQEPSYQLGGPVDPQMGFGMTSDLLRAGGGGPNPMMDSLGPARGGLAGGSFGSGSGINGQNLGFQIPHHFRLQGGGGIDEPQAMAPLSGAMTTSELMQPNVQGFLAQQEDKSFTDLQAEASMYPPGTQRRQLIDLAIQRKQMPQGATPAGMEKFAQYRTQPTPMGNLPGNVLPLTTPNPSAGPPQPLGGGDVTGAQQPTQTVQGGGNVPASDESWHRNLGMLLEEDPHTTLGAFQAREAGQYPSLDEFRAELQRIHPGFEEGGEANKPRNYVTEDELDPHPVVDSSGQSIVIHYPSEGKSLDLGLPTSFKQRAAAKYGGRVRLQTGGATSPQFGELGGGGGFTGMPASSFTGLNQSFPGLSGAGFNAPGRAPGFQFEPSQAGWYGAGAGSIPEFNPQRSALMGQIMQPTGNPFAGISPIQFPNVGQATIPQPMTYQNLMGPQISGAPYGLGANAQVQNPPAVPFSSLGVTPWNPNAWLNSVAAAARGGRIRLQDGGDARDDSLPARRVEPTIPPITSDLPEVFGPTRPASAPPPEQPPPPQQPPAHYQGSMYQALQQAGQRQQALGVQEDPGRSVPTEIPDPQDLRRRAFMPYQGPGAPGASPRHAQLVEEDPTRGVPTIVPPRGPSFAESMHERDRAIAQQIEAAHAQDDPRIGLAAQIPPSVQTPSPAPPPTPPGSRQSIFPYQQGAVVFPWIEPAPTISQPRARYTPGSVQDPDLWFRQLLAWRGDPSMIITPPTTARRQPPASVAPEQRPDIQREPKPTLPSAFGLGMPSEAGLQQELQFLPGSREAVLTPPAPITPTEPSASPGAPTPAPPTTTAAPAAEPGFELRRGTALPAPIPPSPTAATTRLNQQELERQRYNVGLQRPVQLASLPQATDAVVQDARAGWTPPFAPGMHPHWEQESPEFKQAFQYWWNNALTPDQRAGLGVESAFRTFQEQKDAYAKFLRGEISLAAPPGASQHEIGRAADVAGAQLAAARATLESPQAQQRYGLRFPFGTTGPHADPGHLELLRGTAATAGGPPNLSFVPENLRQPIIEAAQRHNLDPVVFASMIQRESSFDPKQVTGDHVGLGQLGAEAARAVGMDPADRTDVNKNLDGSAAYLRSMLDHPRSGGDMRTALTMYRFGPHGPMDDTRYADAVLGSSQQYGAAGPAGGQGGPPDQVVPPGTIQPGGMTGTPGPGTPGPGTPAPSPAMAEPDRGEQILRSPWMALAAAGAGMLASRSPYPGVALGEGILAGIHQGNTMAAQNVKDIQAQYRAEAAAQRGITAQQLADIKLQALHEKAANDAGTLQWKLDTLNQRAKYEGDSLALRAQIAEATSALGIAKLQATEAYHDRQLDQQERNRQSRMPLKIDGNGNYVRQNPENPQELIPMTGPDGLPVKAPPQHGMGAMSIYEALMNDNTDPNRPHYLAEAISYRARLSHDPLALQKFNLAVENAARARAALSVDSAIHPDAAILKARNDILAELAQMENTGAPAVQAAPAPQPGTPQAPQAAADAARSDPAKAIAHAKAWIADHPNDRAAVEAQLKAWGIDPAQLR